MPRKHLGFAVPASVLLVGIVLLCLALAAHAAGMDDHMMDMLGACLAVLAALVVAARPPSPAIRSVVAVAVWSFAAPSALAAPRGRHPPDEGTVLIS